MTLFDAVVDMDRPYLPDPVPTPEGPPPDGSDPGTLRSGLASATQRTLDQHVQLSGPPVTLGWSHVYYHVTIKKRKAKQTVRRCLLDDVSGVARPGHLLAIMGPSGAGKTSLLNALAGRLPKANHGELEGEITVNGRPRDKTFRQMVGYVMQDDVFFANLTVLETLTLAARLKLPKSMTKEEKMEVVNQVILELSLSKAANTRIGAVSAGGISGGEKKRLNVATELITRAPILFLDEPTSNLDAFQALNVMSCLRKVASGGRAVVCTIHQPRSSIYQMFDQLLLMSQGRVIYYGFAKDATDYFSSQGFVCPPHFNPADYFLDLISIDPKTEDLKVDGEDRIQRLGEAYAMSDMPKALQGALGTLRNTETPEVVTSSYQVSWGEQFLLLCKRAFTQLLRDKFGFIIDVSIRLFFALLLGALYFQMGNDQKSIQGRTGLLFFSLIQITFSQTSAVQNTFPSERLVVTRERQAKMYYISAYYLAKTCSETVLKLWSPFLFAVIVYWMTGLNPGVANFFIYVLTLLLVALTGTALGLFISALAPNVNAGAAMTPLIVIIFVLGSGFYQNLGSTPAWMLWLQYISFMRYAFMAFMINEYRGLTFTCTAADTKCYRTGAQVLDSYSIPGTLGAMRQSIGILFAFLLAFHYLAYLVVHFKQARSFIPLNTNGPSWSKMLHEEPDDESEEPDDEADPPLLLPRRHAAVRS